MVTALNMFNGNKIDTQNINGKLKYLQTFLHWINQNLSQQKNQKTSTTKERSRRFLEWEITGFIRYIYIPLHTAALLTCNILLKYQLSVYHA